MSRLFGIVLFCIGCIMPRLALASSEKFSFAVIAHGSLSAPDESVLQAAITETDADTLAFVVAHGIKSKAEPCSDQLYMRRKNSLDKAQNGLILSLTASDWVDCRRDGGSTAIERLNRIRELFFVDEFSFGSSKIPLVRQSLMPTFRTYGENARWQIGEVIFATMHLPAPNNHYLSAAGRNSEFEDRLVANREWLEQLFNIAGRKNLKAIVIFADGNPLHRPGTSSPFNFGPRHDGFAEVRRQLTRLASKFKGKVLIVHNQVKPGSREEAKVSWKKNLGNLGVRSGWIRVEVDVGAPDVFSATEHPALLKTTTQ